jgi:hypothetical protein
VSLLAAYLGTLGGVSGNVVSLSDQELTDINGGFAQSGYSLTNLGRVFWNSSVFGSMMIGDWISPVSAAPGAYEVRADLESGAVDGSATGSWLALTSSRSWSVSEFSNINQAALNVSIRLGGDTLATARIELTAQVL